MNAALQDETKPLSINGRRLWDSLMEMAKIGPGIAGGNNRQTLTDEDGEGNVCAAFDLFLRQQGFRIEELHVVQARVRGGGNNFSHGAFQLRSREGFGGSRDGFACHGDGTGKHNGLWP